MAQGTAVRPSLAPSNEGLTVINGSVQLEIPRIHAPLNVDITNLNLPLDGHHTGEAIKEIGSLVSQYHSGLEEPIMHALEARLAVGGGIGMAVGGVVAYSVLRGLRKESLPERIKRSPRRAAAYAAAAVLAITGYSITGESGGKFSDGPPPKTLDTLVTQRAPILQGAKVTAMGAEIVKNVASGAADYIDSGKRFWQQGAAAFDKTYANFEKRGGNKYADNPNIIAVGHLSDLHCNFANMTYYLGHVLRRFRAPILVNTGDTTTNSGTMPYEKNCISDFVDAVDKAAKANDIFTTILNVAGNHDVKKPVTMTRTHAKMITLFSKKNTATVKGITFVGSEDPRITIWYPTLPDNETAQKQALAKQGHDLAETACRITTETGQAPFVLSHSEDGGKESTLRGCASEVMNGHTHHTGSVKSFTGKNGTIVLQHTAGSASGSDVGFTIWEKAQQDAALTVNYVGKNNGKVLGATTTTLHTDGTVDIRNDDIPPRGENHSQELASIRTFIKRYSTDYQHQPKQRVLQSRPAALDHP